ncbi:MAG: hypothetical protein SOZ27_00890 [Spirochaetia bacterium]|nr:hypothetical protein [Spirochaetia bacterium]
MKAKLLSKPVIGLWGAGILFSLLLIVITGGSAGSVFFRIFLNIVLITLFVVIGWYLWNRFLSETDTSKPRQEENDDEDEILLESDPNRLYTETGFSDKTVTESSNANLSKGDAFSNYRYGTETESDGLRHLDSRNPYEMSDSLLRKLKSEEEDSLAKFKAAFQSPEEIAKAVRTQLHKDD